MFLWKPLFRTIFFQNFAFLPLNKNDLPGVKFPNVLELAAASK